VAIIYLGLGSNIDSEDNLRLGVRELRRRYGELQVSDLYKNAAVGFEGPDFLNLVVACESTATPVEVHEQIESIHRMAGRYREEERFSSRPLDIDLLLYDDLVINEGPVRIPRSDVLEFSFVLRPLAELAPDLVHPVTKRTMAEHWQLFDSASHPLTPVSVIL
jgi:2-amino-4-hydroxy-6-hydroxymethyldihydropteridine diphosphokinase